VKKSAKDSGNYWVRQVPYNTGLTCVRIRTRPGLTPGKYRNGQMVDWARWFSTLHAWFRMEQAERCSDWLLIGRAK
jgi:hypothetical protein